MISVEKKDGFNIKISRRLREATSHKLDLYLFVPGELGLTTHVVPESEFYHNAIHVKRTYYSDKHHLPLVHSRLASRGKLSSEQYRLSLSLYAYQYIVALETSTREVLSADEESQLDQLQELVELALGILKRLRRNTPSDDGMLQYYVNIDNYLSWATEQRLLSLIVSLPDSEDYHPVRERLLEICEAESAYRYEQNYNSSHALQDPERISNKMRLLRRLIEHPVTLGAQVQELGQGEEKLVKGTATAIVMIFVTLMVLQANHVLSHLTTLFVFVLAIIYALREVFKDDLRNTLWRWLRKGRPKWRRHYFDANSGELVGRQLEWFDYQRVHKLDDDILVARRANVTQREEVVLHYGSSSRMSPTRFLSGYEEVRETLLLDLDVLSKLMDKGAHDVYRLIDGEVACETVEKRYLVNLVARQTQGDGQATIQRWKIVMNRSRIIDIEAVT
ncbi:hypothetical protein [Modicisalibacter luteus]|uniref:Uncharacterized protein n=1 Tax=Modicisalibacter luteus TaxID=453962 RepID=A0ABV7M207_9GAMM|nr:hypothetical protein [Halomonas lutea]GHB08260.1 hypothetical protein GCM10007159_33050 [Halomonas lutea]